jgi:hypothetical protein
MGGEVVAPGIEKPVVYLVESAADRCVDIADRLRAAARLVEYGVVDLDATARIVTGALARLDRLRDDQASIDGAA